MCPEEKRMGEMTRHEIVLINEGSSVLLLIRPTVKLGTNLWSASILVWIRSVWSHACSSTLSPSEEMNTWRTSSSCEELRCEETSQKVNEMQHWTYSRWNTSLHFIVLCLIIEFFRSFRRSFNTTHTEVWCVRSEFTHCQLWRMFHLKPQTNREY